MFVLVVDLSFDTRQQVIDEATSEILSHILVSRENDKRARGTHTKSAITFVFGEPISEVPATCMCLRKTVTLAGAQRVVSDVSIVSDFGWSVSQALGHRSIKARASLLLSDLANEATVLVGRPIPHLGNAMREFTLQS